MTSTEYMKDYFARNPEQYEKHRERTKAYREQRKQKFAEYQRKRNWALAGLDIEEKEIEYQRLKIVGSPNEDVKKEMQNSRNRDYYLRKKIKDPDWTKRLYRDNLFSHLLSRVKNRAAKKGIDFDLDKEYLESIKVEVCPVFGQLLIYGGERNAPWTASLDRIDNSKGYIKGNVWFISNRANIIKGDATIQELRSLLSALEGGKGPYGYVH